MTDKIRTKQRLVANRVTEKDVRNWLDSMGYSGGGAVFEELELHAIQRPGWRQVFRFTVRATHLQQERKVLIFGCVKDDERHRNTVNQTQIRTFDSLEARKPVLEQWAEGMIVRQPGDSMNGSFLWAALIFFVLLVLLLMFNAWLVGPG